MDANEKEQRVPVATGETDGTYTEITEGSLKEGDPVIVALVAKVTRTSGSSPGSQTSTSRGRGF